MNHLSHLPFDPGAAKAQADPTRRNMFQWTLWVKAFPPVLCGTVYYVQYRICRTVIHTVCQCSDDLPLRSQKATRYRECVSNALCTIASFRRHPHFFYHTLTKEIKKMPIFFIRTVATFRKAETATTPFHCRSILEPPIHRTRYQACTRMYVMQSSRGIRCDGIPTRSHTKRLRKNPCSYGLPMQYEQRARRAADA